MKYLVTGARGFVGARLMAALKNAVAAPSLRNATEETIKRLIDQTEPDVILHTAAISDISACEKNKEASYRANVLLPLWLAKTGVKLVSFSTDQVYSGCEEDGPYDEETVSPANLYARQKLEMEERALDLNPDTVHLRATWMYDMPLYGIRNRGNFLMNMLLSPTLSFSSVQFRGITYVRQVAANIEKAAQLPGGVYNYGSENTLNMMDTAKWLKNELKLPIFLQESLPRHNLWMNCEKAKRQGIAFPGTVEGLKQCILDYSLQTYE